MPATRVGSRLTPVQLFAEDDLDLVRGVPFEEPAEQGQQARQVVRGGLQIRGRHGRRGIALTG
ncbi:MULTISPECIES: hypothetical protein [unclassified Streptomyces]|uniref:hypothetical protein n=1 Tax=unclassified Streptomyces TaxID=2593676 RepID=UPI000DAD73E2|nr:MULTISPECIES: hypothetical protein [unclassified Streptomyces]PZT76050.1 hypothetical protein DNK56_21995 [Streptomyces sp. AC1-42W]PZT79999.1 hypothetical protein DNK55_10690 [Streptomyces sp. AC1-42T]